MAHREYRPIRPHEIINRVPLEADPEDPDMTNQRVKLARCRDGQNHIDPKECPAYNSDLREHEPVYVRAGPVAQAIAGDPGELNEPPLHPGATLTGGSVPRHYAGAFPALSCCGGQKLIVPLEADPDSLMPFGVIDGDALLKAVGGDVGFEPRTIVVEPPEGDDWIERYRETVRHGCQRTDVHALAECVDWPCPNINQDECLMVRERYAARTHSDVIPPCVHHDDVGGREGPERGIE
jgi:hypothetical protein